MATKRIYGKYEPITTKTRETIDKVYGDKEKEAREIAYKVSEISEPIDQTVLFHGAAAINAAYMFRNTEKITGTEFISPKIRDFKDNMMEEEIYYGLKEGTIQC